MSRRRSVAFIPVAVGALLGALGVVSVSAAPPAGTDASEVTHWNQVAASTLAAIPGAERRCAARIPDQHGHGAGRRVRRGQRDRTEAASAISAQEARWCEGVDRRCRRNGGIRRALEHRLDRTRDVPFPGRAGLLTTLATESRRIARCDRRWRLQEAGHRGRARGGQGHARRESGRRTVRAVPVGAEHRRRKVAAAHQSATGQPILDPTPWAGGVKPFLIQSSSQFRSVPPPALDSPQWAAEFNEVKALGRATGSTRMTPCSDADVQGQVVAERTQPELERSRPAAHRTQRPRRRRRREAARAAEPERGGRGDQLLERQVPLRLLAAVERDHHERWTMATPPPTTDASWTALITAPYPEWTSGHNCLDAAHVAVLRMFFGDAPGGFQITSIAS